MLELTDYYDISPEISEKTLVWPGDTPLTREVLVDYASGKNYLLSTIRTTVHIGAHADAPCHYDPAGEGISERSLHYYLGPCQVISILKPKEQKGYRIVPEDLRDIEIKAKRILFRTLSFRDQETWNTDFWALSPELIEFLSSQGVILVGLDTPSVDLFNDTELKTHRVVAKKNMAILEGVVLEAVSDGLYQLIALPLKLKGVDASPVRAVLVPL